MLRQCIGSTDAQTGLSLHTKNQDAGVQRVFTNAGSSLHRHQGCRWEEDLHRCSDMRDLVMGSMARTGGGLQPRMT